MENTENWDACKSRLANVLSQQEFDTCITPLILKSQATGGFVLFSPNGFIRDKVEKNYLSLIRECLFGKEGDGEITLVVGRPGQSQISRQAAVRSHSEKSPVDTSIDRHYTFENFVQGKSNQLGRAAAIQVAENPGKAYNPLLLYGGTGLGKTHLLHAIGNEILKANKKAKVVYLHSERYIQNMIKAVRHNLADEFKNMYRDVDCLLVDDIQFFAGKERTQEEFFHTFNRLLEGRQQIVLSCDKYPKEVEDLEPRLKSRFSWGLTVAIEPPDFETRVAILQSKASEQNIQLSDEVAYFIAKHLRSHVRDLEGALNTLTATSRFHGRMISVDFARECLKDLLSAQSRLLTVENIQRKVCEHYKINMKDLLSSSRKRSLVRPRQMAMWLCKDLTEHSLPEIGEAFGGRDHTTVLHACKKISELSEQDSKIEEDKTRLIRQLTT